MAALRRSDRARSVALGAAAALLLACGAGGGAPEPGVAATGETGGAPPSETGGARTTGGAPLGGAAPMGGDGIGLYSSVFEPAAGAGGGSEPVVVECDYSTPGCDYTRLQGCCEPLACTHANGADVWDTYPIEACEALVACMQANPACTTAEDPLCFMNEDPNGPCIDETYAASHTDPEGPYAWTLELMRCVCGY